MQFTICTVCYNAEASIENTIESVLALVEHEGDKRDFEYLIIDGASTDATHEIIASKEERFPAGMLRVISEPDKGIYDAMNKGIANARGRFIMFINADDLIAARTLEFARQVLAQVENAETVEGIAGSVEVLASDEASASLQRIRKVNPLMLKGPVPKDMVTGHQGMLFSVKKAQELGGFKTEYKLAADYDFYVRSIQANSRWLLIDRTLARFYLGGASFNLIDTAREYRRVRIDNGMNPVSAYLLYFTNVFNALRARKFKNLK